MAVNGLPFKVGMNCMYKMIACDLDETLISLDRTISKENKEAIAQAIAKGIKFVPATGRGYRSLHSLTKELGLFDLKDQYCISYNGGAITENKDEKEIYFQGISFEKASALYQRGLAYPDICIHVYTPEMVWVKNFFSWEKEYLASRQACTEIFTNHIDFLKDEKIAKVIYTNLDHNYLEKIAKDMEDLTENMDISYSSNRYLEINAAGVNKGNALKKLCKMTDIDIKDTIAIGDNYNDLSMIQEAGLGIGVANTVEEMKKDCDYITKADCNHSAIAEVIHQFVL